MRHPNSRSERRAVRELYITRRKFIRQHIWSRVDQPIHEGSSEWRWYIIDLCRVSPIAEYDPAALLPLPDFDPSLLKRESFDEWGRYAKFNLKCTCRTCQYRHACNRQGRLDETLTVEENLRSWE